MKLGEYVNSYRTKHELSMRQFASMCGLSYGYISMLEKGINPSTGTPIRPTLQTIRSLAGGMGTTMHEILSNVEDLDLDMSEEKKPAPESGLSEIAMQVGRIVDRLPPESRQAVLAVVQQLAQAIPDPAASEESLK